MVEGSSMVRALCNGCSKDSQINMTLCTFQFIEMQWEKKMLEGLPQCVGAWMPRRTCSKFSPRMKRPLGHAEMHIAYNVVHICSVFCTLWWWCSIKMIRMSRGWMPISIM